MPSGNNAVRWTDEKLREAINGERSWRGTARALGLRGTSAGTLRALKKRAAALELDVSHFTTQRRWSDGDLRDAVASSSSWAEVIRRLGLSDRGEARVRVKGHAVRLGLSYGHLAERQHKTATILDLSPDRAMLPRAAEQFASAWFSVRGVTVAKPEQPTPYDLLIGIDREHYRVQVKTTRFRAAHGTWVVNIGRRPYALDKTASRVPYDPDELDYFFIIDGDLDLYLIPSDVVAGMTAISVGAYKPYLVGEASSLFADSRSDPGCIFS